MAPNRRYTCTWFGVLSSGFEVRGSRFRLRDSVCVYVWFGVRGLGKHRGWRLFGLRCSVFGVWGSGFFVIGLGVWGSGFSLISPFSHSFVFLTETLLAKQFSIIILNSFQNVYRRVWPLFAYNSCRFRRSERRCSGATSKTLPTFCFGNDALHGTFIAEVSMKRHYEDFAAK